jgi:glycosyltransferase involved in cell wall biosynthesis
MHPGLPEYSIVTPIHNELQNVMRLVDSVRSFTIAPAKWLIVDDNSTDGSIELLQTLISDYPKACIVKYEGINTIGWLGYGNVVQFGIERLEEWERDTSKLSALVAVVDSDVLLEGSYFERLMIRMDAEPNSALATGFIAEVKDDSIDEIIDSPRQRGAAILYKKSFLNLIGGFPRCPSPDSAVVIKARNRGFNVVVVPDAGGIHLTKNPMGYSLISHRNKGMSARINGLDIVSMMLFAALSLIESGGKESLEYAMAYLRTSVQQFAPLRDSEIIRFYHNSWIRFLRQFVCKVPK